MIHVLEKRLNWESVDSIPRLYEKELHLLSINLDEFLPFYQELCFLLSYEEKEYLHKYIFEKERITFGISQSVLRLLLGFYIKKNPQEILFSKGAKGKPFISQGPEPKIYFNKSHSNKLVLFGITLINEIGVDVEMERDFENLFDMTNLVFSDKEKELIFKSPAHLRKKLFFSLWTCKEAYTKATGSGLSDNIKSFEILKFYDFMNNVPFSNTANNANLTLEKVDTMDGYSAAFCLLGNYEKVSFFRLSPSFLNWII